MKNLILSLLLSTAATAANKIVCQEYDRSNNEVLSGTIVFEAIGETMSGPFDVSELQFPAETKTPYEMTYYENGPLNYLGKTYRGYVYTEDVQFIFKAEKEDVSFKLYLDEMNEGYLYVKSFDTMYFFCN